MKKKFAASSAFSYRRLLTSLAFCIIGLLFVLGVAFSATKAPTSISAPPAQPNKTAVPAPSFEQGPAPSAQRWPKPQPNVVFDVLYDQNDHQGTQSTSSQNFETSNDSFDDQAADDFVVPGGQSWVIQQVVVTGIYFNGPGPALSFNVWFHSDSGTLPGPVVAGGTQLNSPYTDTAGIFTITLPSSVLLGPGTYWVSVQANIDFGVGGQWSWTNRTTISNSGAAWRNPGGGFGSGCTSWGRRAFTCNISPTEPDQMFQILGVAGGPGGTPTPSPSPCVNYAFSIGSGSIVPGTDDTGNHTDDGSTLIALPFTYNLYDNSFNTVSVGSNGHLAFGIPLSNFNVSCIPVLGATYTIGPYWTDQCTGPCQGVNGTSYGIFTSVSGVAPNRIFNIEWRTAYYNSGGDGVPLNYEVRLYEGQLAFDVIYGTIPPSFTPPAGRNLSIGVQRSGSGEFTLVGCDTSGGGSPPVSSGQRYHYTLGCGTPSPSPTGTPCLITRLSEDFDDVTAPALPAGWIATNVIGVPPLWVTTTSTPDTAPNAAFIDDPAFITDKNLETPSIAITTASAEVRFRNFYNLEPIFDGAVLEVSSPNINGGAFTDITNAAVGGVFSSGGYNATISTDFQSPIAGRMAWTGNIQGYINSVATLGPNVAGQTIKLRFRMASDNSVSGTGWRLDTVSVTDGPCPPPTPTPSGTPAQALNLSTRMQVLVGDNVGIGGFIVIGGAPKQVLLRAIGPSLGNFGVPNPLQDPEMELHGPAGFTTILNDNWRDTQESEILATGLAPTNNAESAILVTLNPGAYTAVVKGKNNSTGTALVEAYDLSSGAASKLGNISTRAFVNTGADIMIAGFILGANTGNGNIILRGIGPSLSSSGIPNPLTDPTLELHDGNGGLLMANNNWQDDPTQAAIISGAGLAPTNGLESGIAAMLPPGQYTALLSGVNNGTGVGLVEVYDVVQ